MKRLFISFLVLICMVTMVGNPAFADGTLHRACGTTINGNSAAGTNLYITQTCTHFRFLGRYADDGQGTVSVYIEDVNGDSVVYLYPLTANGELQPYLELDVQIAPGTYYVEFTNLRNVSLTAAVYFYY